MFSDLPTPGYNQTGFERQPSNTNLYAASTGLQQQQQGRNTPTPTGFENMGFVPMHQQTYDTGAGTGYGSLNGAVGGARDVKSRRRESGMLLMNMGAVGPNLGGQKKSSMQQLREEASMVPEESAFE